MFRADVASHSYTVRRRLQLINLTVISDRYSMAATISQTIQIPPQSTSNYKVKTPFYRVLV